MVKQENKSYYVGFDMGSTSVGWAVTNVNYKVLGFKGRAMWGVRRFEEGKTAEKRRIKRINRRRLNRRKLRLEFLKHSFKETIEAIDPQFFVRLKESHLHSEDKSVNTIYTLFSDDTYTDVDFYKAYKTIYHLRYELMQSTQPHDVRLVFLALHHLLKYRGHFLIPGKLDATRNIKQSLSALNDVCEQQFGVPIFDFSDNTFDLVESILKDPFLTRQSRVKKLKKILYMEIPKTLIPAYGEVLRLMCGLKVDLGKLLNSEEFKGGKIDLSGGELEEQLSKIEAMTPEIRHFIEVAKSCYDWSVLSNILKDYQYISEAKVASYQAHHQDLRQLRRVLKAYDKAVYHAFFNDETAKNNYVAYIGRGDKACPKEDFYKELKTLLDKCSQKDQDVQEIRTKIENNTFLLKLRNRDNGVIPHQLHANELAIIVDNASSYLPFLNVVDEKGLSLKDKLKQLMSYRVPYYIGPVNPYHQTPESKRNWVVRKETGRVYPWNFEEKIDVEKTAEAFIRKMTNKCQYVKSADVLPKHSLMYQRFEVLNELNPLKINGNSITVELKQQIYEELFKGSTRKVTKRLITQWLVKQGLFSSVSECTISGVDDVLKSKLSSYHDMKQVFSDELPSEEVLEQIILWITLFGEASDLLTRKLKSVYPTLITDEVIQALVTKRYVGWGRLSYALLNQVVDSKCFVEPTGILQAMYERNETLMGLLSEKYNFMNHLNEMNNSATVTVPELNYELVEALYTSPAVKRSIWQTLKLMDEIVSIKKAAPTRIFLEMTRGEGEKKRTKSRKDQLLALYENIKSEQVIYERIKQEDELKLRSKKLYLYYLQQCRCMYSGEIIPYDELFDHNKYDIDHIYPRSLTKDDSFNNLVLVKAELNREKSDKREMDRDMQRARKIWWMHLKQGGFISSEKYDRLVRTTPLSDEELSGFIARQIVETSQATKAVATLFKQLYPDTEIVYVKARNVSDFRRDNNLLKSRMINDFHHAQDAYLNIVVGNVYRTKFTDNPLNFVQNATHRSYNLAKVFNKIVERHNQIAWVPGEEGTLKRVKKQMRQHDILVTWLSTYGSGELFDATIYKKGSSEQLIPLKKSLPTSKYGGYKNSFTDYCVIVASKGKKNSQLITIETVPLHVSATITTDGELLNYLHTEVGLVEPRIILNHLPKTNMLIESDGRKARITGKTGERFALRNEYQPVFDRETTEVLTRLEKVLAKDNTDIILNNGEFSHEALNRVYLVFLNKTTHPLYQAKLKNLRSVISDGYERFEQLEFKEKAYILSQLLLLFTSTRMTSDLKLIGGASQVGVYSLTKNLSKCAEFIIINQSVTGLFENRTDMLALCRGEQS